MFRQTSWWTKQEEAMAQALIYKASHTRPLGKCFRCWPYFCYSRGCIMVAYIWFFMLALGGLTLLMVLGIGTVRPYLYSLQFKKTYCQTLASWYVQNDDGSVETRSCSCGKYCTGNWPCLQIYIQYQAAKEDGSIFINTTLADSQYELTDGHECTFKPLCARRGNNEDVLKYQEKWGVEGTEFRCYVNPDDQTMVFRKRRLSHRDMLHCLLWPALVTIVFIVMLLVVVLTCGCDFIWTQRPPSVLCDYGGDGHHHYLHQHTHHHHDDPEHINDQKHELLRERCSLCRANSHASSGGGGGGGAGNHHANGNGVGASGNGEGEGGGGGGHPGTGMEPGSVLIQPAAGDGLSGPCCEEVVVNGIDDNTENKSPMALSEF